MGALSTVPETVTLSGYAGDDLVIHIAIDKPGYATGCTWSGEIRRTRDAGVDTTWGIVADASGNGATITLTGAQTKALVESIPVVVSRVGAPPTPAAKYTGVFDIQIVKTATGYTKTLLQGSLTIELDVTKA